MAHDVFISYSAPDKATADAICLALEGKGINCWIAPRNILASAEYSEAIVDAIAASSILILVFSAYSNKSRDVASELDLAFQNEKDIPILAFRIENLKPSKGTAYYLSASNWLDAFTPPLETHLERLVNDVQRLLKREPPPQTQQPQLPQKTQRQQPPVWMKVLVAVGVVLAMFLFARWLFKPQPETSGKGNDATVNSTGNNPTGVANPNNTNMNAANAVTVNPVTGNAGSLTTNTGNDHVAGNVNKPPAKVINYEQQDRDAVGLLKETNPTSVFEGIRLLAEICKSGNADWYWIAMNQLTDYVRINAHWDGEEGPSKLSADMRAIIFRILEVVAAQRPPYPDGAKDDYLREHRRNLESTDLRGLRLVGGVVQLEYVNFQGANLDDAYLPNAILNGARLRDASLKRADLHGAKMAMVDLDRANIDKTNLGGVEGLQWFDVKGASKWYCAIGVNDELIKEIRNRKGFKQPTAPCD